MYLDSIEFLNDPVKGTIQVHLPARNREAANRALLGGTELSVTETIAALRWQRERPHCAQVSQYRIGRYATCLKAPP